MICAAIMFVKSSWSFFWTNCFMLLHLAAVLDYASGFSQSITDEFRYHEVSQLFISNNKYEKRISLNESIHQQEIVLGFTAYNKSFTIPLVVNKNLLSATYTEKHFVTASDSIINKPSNHLLQHCYYQSRSASIPAAVSICGGVSGYFVSGKDTFYIHPISGTLSDHYIFRASDHLHVPGKCGVDHGHISFTAELDHIERIKRAVHKPYDANEKTRFVELYLVADRGEFQQHDQNRPKLIHRMKEIVNIVNSLYRKLNIYIALVGIEIWEQSDRIVIEDSADKTMQNFLAYRKQYINPDHKNDNAQLLTGRKFADGIVGKAMKEPICTFQYSGGVNTDSSSISRVVAVTLAHEMGHNFGFEHDAETCDCPEDKCIMAAVSGLNYPTSWSSCSEEYLKKAFDAGMDYCLKDLPLSLYNGPLCGNGFVEQGEQCDCGLPEDCTSKCCNATTCMLNTNATCASGSCCDQDKCELKEASTECREAQAECDLPEYCSGKSEFCPEDFYKEDGSDCSDGTAYCYNGQCNSYDKQCKFLWGPTGKNGHELCYTRLNHEGSGNGNCGFNWLTKTFKPCAPADVFCGMLHCYHQAEKLAFWKPSLTYLLPELHITTSMGDKYFCQSAILDIGYHVPDPGMVPDGTKCGKDMMCMNQQCLTKRQVNFPNCLNSNCSDHGVCNNKGHCHCDCGWAPPYCNTTGTGGSTDSGPVCGGPPGGFQWLVLFLVLLIIVMLLCCVVVVIVYRDKIRIRWRELTYTVTNRIGRCTELLSKYPRPRAPSVPSQPPSAPELDLVVTAAKPSQAKVQRTQSVQAKVQRTQSVNRGDISGPILQSSTLKDTGILVELQKPLYENEVFRPGNKKARPPSLAEPSTGPALPPRATNIHMPSDLYLSPKPMPTRSAPLPPGQSDPRRPPLRPAPPLKRATPEATLSPADIIVKFNQNTRGNYSNK